MAHVAPLEMTQYSPHEQLKQLLKEANYDGALKKVLDWDLTAILDLAPSDPPLLKLQLLCMIADVLDYSGDYSLAQTLISQSQPDRYVDFLSTIHSIRDASPHGLGYVKQCCWVVMMWGMCFYRNADFQKARRLFDRARHVLTFLCSSEQQVMCVGTLARAWYCLGLVEREEHHYSDARTAFTNSIKLTGDGIKIRFAAGQSIVSFDYHMARCYGLGIGWIAYDQSLLKEAMGELVLARRLMLPIGHATFIRAYIDLVHASVMLSESNDISRIDAAIALLKSTRDRFAPDSGHKHVPYRLKADNELARAYLRRARAVGHSANVNDLETAELYVNHIKSEARGQRGTTPRCAAFITEARVLRERGKFSEAHEVAQKAKTQGGHFTFVLINSCIGIGEAAMGMHNYRLAIAQFREALLAGRDSPKIAAVCRLHLCNAYLDDNQPAAAMEQYRAWQESHGGGLENAFIAKLSADVEKRLSQTFDAFGLTKQDIIPLQPYDVYLNWLRRWLADTAFALEGDDEQRAADRIGIGIQQFGRWRVLNKRP